MTMNYNYEAIPGMADALRQIQEKHGKDHKKSSAKPKRWWDDDGDGVGYEPHEVKSSKKEGYDVDTANRLWSEISERLEKLGEMDNTKFKVIGEKMDAVGKEDKDIDNDGDHDKSDKYLHARRKKIGKILAMKGKK